MDNNLNQAIAKINGIIKGNRKIVKIYDGQNKYLFVTSDGTQDNYDPYYTVDKRTNKVEHFDPVSDIDWYLDAIETEPIKG